MLLSPTNPVHFSPGTARSDTQDQSDNGQNYSPSDPIPEPNCEQRHLFRKFPPCSFSSCVCRH